MLSYLGDESSRFLAAVLQRLLREAGTREDDGNGHAHTVRGSVGRQSVERRVHLVEVVVS